MKRIWLVRHGECEMNLHLAETIGGRDNGSPLTELGIDQAKALGKHLQRCLSGQQLEGMVFSSTAVRAVDTARIALDHVAPGISIPSTDRLLEIEMGSFAGQKRAECYTPEVLAKIAEDPWNFSPPGGESQRQVEERIKAYIMEEVMPVVKAGGPPAIVVGHGLAIRCALRWILGSDPSMTVKMRIDNTAITEIAWQETGPRSGWQLHRVNDTTHLASAGVTAASLGWEQPNMSR